MLVRALSNLAVCVVPGREARFLTPEQGNYSVMHEGDDDTFLHAVAARLAPLAESTLVVDNIFTPDLEPELWGGDEQTAALRRAGERLDALDLLPAPFPIEKILPGSRPAPRHAPVLAGRPLLRQHVGAQGRHALLDERVGRRQVEAASTSAAT